MEISVKPCQHEPGLWWAMIDDLEGDGPRGEGTSAHSALCELARELWDAEDPALFECLALILELEADQAAKRARQHEYSSIIAAQADGWAGGLHQAARTMRGIV